MSMRWTKTVTMVSLVGTVGLAPGGCGRDPAADSLPEQIASSGGLPGRHADADRDDGHADLIPGAPRVRLLSPLSGSLDDSTRPLFRWTGGPGTVQVCSDRRCDDRVTSFRGASGEARPHEPLPAGTLFWRVTAAGRSTPAWQITIPHRDSGRPIAFGTIPDFNGDGLSDVAFGVTGATTGRVEIFFGSTSLPGPRPDLVVRGGPSFGCGVAAVGDTNGDGFTDLGVASDCAGDRPGTVFVFEGGPRGPVQRRVLHAGPVTAGFGTTIAGAGDVNGDGYGDIIVGGHEVAQIFLGGPTGVSTTPVASLTSNNPDGATNVQGPGDVNGDGRPDVAVTFQLFQGAVYLSNGAGFTRQDLAPSTVSGWTFAGDVNDDGFCDFDSFAILPGTPSGVDPVNYLNDQAGMPLYAAAGDVNGDGFADTVQLVPGFTNFPEHYRIVFGQPQACGTNGCAPFVRLFPPGLTSDDFAIIAAVGDVDGDAVDDIVIARPSIGTVELYVAASGFSGPPARTWTGPVGFGVSVPALFGTATFFDTP